MLRFVLSSGLGCN